MREAIQGPTGFRATVAKGPDDTLDQRLRCQQTLHAAGRLVGGVAHDFNNMLAAIQGFASLLGGQVEPDSAAAGYVDEIRAAVEQSFRLNRQLQAFNRKQVLRAEPADLNEVLGGAVPVLRLLLGDRIALGLDLDADLAPVKLDATQVVQVLINIALNARDAMPEGGCLALRTTNLVLAERRQHPDGFVIPAGSWALLMVADSGTGMNEATRARMFEPFFTTHVAENGAGLGLSTVHGIIRQLGGYVWAESTVGAGTTVCICLPDASAAPGAATSPQRAAIFPRPDRLTA